jgi:hypothetical protein
MTVTRDENFPRRILFSTFKQATRRTESNSKSLRPCYLSAYEKRSRAHRSEEGWSRGAWPISERGELIVYKGLAKALMKETLEAVSARWGVSLEKLRRWHDKLSTASAPQSRSRVPSAGRIFRNGYGWRPEEDELVELLHPQDAAEILQRSHNAVILRRKRLRNASHREDV